MNIYNWLAIFILIFSILVIVYLNYYYNASESEVENFDVLTSSQNELTELYQSLLKRAPKATELKDDSKRLDRGQITIYGIRQRLIDTQEYKNLVKLQSNSLTPELPKMISDRDMLNRLAEIYKEECNKVIPDNMVLPIRDIYIYLDYNEYAYKAMLRDISYPSFEQDVSTTPDLNNPQLMDIFNKYYSKNKLITTGEAIYKAELAQSKEPHGVAPSCKYDAHINDCDGDSSFALTSAIERAQAKFDKNAAARALSEGNTTPDFNTDAAANDIRIPTHQGDMVLLPEMAWSVPMKRAPVCTTLGQPSLIQPVMNDSKLLLGMNLKDAKLHTNVGSIMPSFQHKEFITVSQ